LLTAERLRELLHYDPATGIFRWLQPQSRRVKAGEIAGGVPGQGGYYRIGIDGQRYYAHRLAWLYMTGEWPSRQVDHRDTDSGNNAWGNLRLATQGQNNCNAPKRSHNKTGYKGVSYSKSNRGFIAWIRANGVQHYLGTFPTPEEAHAAYCEASKRLHGEFARAA
jgi:hypothetical protein